MPTKIPRDWREKGVQRFNNDKDRPIAILLENELVINFIETLLEEARQEEREKTKEDMYNKLQNWHGSGKAMLDDYFLSL